MYTGGVLDLPDSEQNKIENELKDAPESQKKERAVTFWVSNHPYASWRLLITRLDQEMEHAVADRIRHHAETVTGTFLCIM